MKIIKKLNIDITKKKLYNYCEVIYLKKNKLGNKISYNIKRIMSEKGIIQKELAKKMNLTEVNMSAFFTRLENNGSSNVRTLSNIADALETELYLFFK